jgi:glycosyltransferase involved in cell wall biosynthesis
MISVVVPVFNEEGNVAKLHAAIVAAMRTQQKPYEIIFVDDGSSDKTAEIAATLTPLRLVRLQRNYGQTPAIDTGIYNSKGDTIVLIDADLQNDPMDIPRFLQKMEEGYDVVLGWRQNRRDHWRRVAFSKFANGIARRLLGLTVHDFGCGLKAYRARFIKDFRLWGEAQVFLPAVAKERGARIAEVTVEHYARETGVAKVKISKMIRGGFDLVGIVFFVKYFSRPLRFFGGWGLVSVALSVAAFGAAIILRLTGTLNITETPLPIVGSLFAILGVMLLMMGFLAEMLLRIHYSATGASPYVIREITENQ